MFQFVPALDFPTPHPRVQTALYDALESLRIADAKLEKARADFGDGDHEYIGDGDLLDAQICAAHFALCLQEIIGGVMPSIPDHAFHELAEFANREERNPPHFEGACLILHLACRSLDRAMDLSRELDGPEIDAAYELMVAARSCVSFHAGLIDQVTIGFLGDDADEILDAIISRRPVPSPDQLRSKWRKCRPAQAA